MEIRFFHPGKAYLNHRGEMLGEIDRVLKGGDLILRQDLDDFEARFAAYTGKKHAIGVNSGTDALYLSLWALGVGPGDEVITSAHTFVASVQVIVQHGATPVLVDCRDDLLIHEEDIRKAITKNTKVIIPVHLTGDVVRFSDEFLRDLAVANIKIIEDAAQALGATGVGYGLTQCYSFYPAKILGAYGDAGAITTDYDGLADEFRNLRNHCKRGYSKWGINSRLDNLQATILNVRMKYLPDMQYRRAHIAHIYGEKLLNISGLILPEYTGGRVWQDYIIRVRGAKRDELYQFLKDAGIETMKNEYPMPIPKTQNAGKIESETLRIPCNDVLERHEIDYVIYNIIKYFE